jgi:hypothetical protein
MIDPLPGPRSARDFDGLSLVDGLNRAFTASTRPIPPAGSTLPELAAQIDATVVLLDPSGGATGLRKQLRSLVGTTKAERIEILDVGGDILALGDESTLRSPLADALVLAAADRQRVPVEVRVVGAGLDGELPAATVDQYLRSLSGRQVGRLSAIQAQAVLPILEWHPSEATALTVAAAQGLRGTVEIRQEGHLVELTDKSADVWAIEHSRVLNHSRPAQALQNSPSLDAAEDAVRAVCGRSELDAERRKSDVRRTATAPPPLGELLAAVDAYCAQAHARGVDYVTFRRLAEVVGLDAKNAGELRRRLIADHPAHYFPPLWSVTRRPTGLSSAGTSWNRTG